MIDDKGEVYLIHFDQPYKGTRHYIGWTSKGAEQRLKRHKEGRGAALLRALNRAGIKYDIARVWIDKSFAFEIELKKQKNSKRFCPICKSTHEV